MLEYLIKIFFFHLLLLLLLRTYAIRMHRIACVHGNWISFFIQFVTKSDWENILSSWFLLVIAAIELRFSNVFSLPTCSFILYRALYKLVIRWRWSLLFARLDRRRKLNWKHSMQINAPFTRCLPVAFSKNGNIFHFYFKHILSEFFFCIITR